MLIQDKSIHLQDYTSIATIEFLADIELPKKFISVIKNHPKLVSVGQLIRQCYQLNNETHLTPKDISSELFCRLYSYLHVTISSQKRGVNILLHGEPVVSKTELTKTIARALKCDLFDISKNQHMNDTKIFHKLWPMSC